MSKQTIQQVQEAYAGKWMAIPGVQGVALGMSDGKPCILILSSVNAQQLRTQIPAAVQGYPIVIQETGPFDALDLL